MKSSTAAVGARQQCSCLWCGKEFKSKSKLKKHIGDDHMEEHKLAANKLAAKKLAAEKPAIKPDPRPPQQPPSQQPLPRQLKLVEKWKHTLKGLKVPQKKLIEQTAKKPTIKKPDKAITETP
ncbi:hypothetical protein FJTKL_12924 [Diaporthe vaccinii]|uniref:C2H2-type domain-containing protein n=1 Tax=Diaporthe vaccinii TaxID=105482 RepID=A0ABR4FA25_9PEZI